MDSSKDRKDQAIPSTQSTLGNNPSIEKDVVSIAGKTLKLSMQNENSFLMAARLLPATYELMGLVAEKDNRYFKCIWDLRTMEEKERVEFRAPSPSRASRNHDQFCFLPVSDLTYVLAYWSFFKAPVLTNHLGNVVVTFNSQRDDPSVTRMAVSRKGYYVVGVQGRGSLYGRYRNVVMWDFQGKEIMRRSRERFRDMLPLDTVTQLRILSGNRFAVSGRIPSYVLDEDNPLFHTLGNFHMQHTELWDPTSLNNPRVVGIPGYFLHETKEGVITWYAPSNNQGAYLRLYDYEGKLINSCQFSFPHSSYDPTIPGLGLKTPYILNLPNGHFLLPVEWSEPKKVCKLYHFNGNLELCSVTEIQNGPGNMPPFGDGHSILQPDELSSSVPLMLFENGVMWGSPVEYCQEYNKTMLNKGIESVLGEHITRPVRAIIADYVGEDVGPVPLDDSVSRSPDQPVKLERKELELFLNILITGLSDKTKFPPEPGIKDKPSGIWSPLPTSAEALAKDLADILSEVKSTDDSKMEALTNKILSLVNDFVKKMNNNLENPQNLYCKNFLELLGERAFQEAYHGAFIPFQIHSLTLKKICELMKKTLELKPS